MTGKIGSALGKVGTICGIGALISILAVAASAVFTRLMNVEMAVFTIVMQWGPGITSVLGGVSSAVTYWGWFQILRRKRKLQKKDEAKGEAQNQLGDFINSLPEIFNSLGCFPQLITAVLGISLVASTATYTPIVDIIKPADTGKGALHTPDTLPPPPVQEKEEEQETEEETKVDIIGKLNVSGGKVDVLGGRRGWANVTIELLKGSAVVASTETDEEGGYAFIGMPQGEYSVRAKAEGYRQIESRTQNKYDLEMVPEEAPKEKEKEEDAPIEMPGKEGKYVVEVMAMENRAQASRMVKRMAENGVEAQITQAETAQGTKYRISVGNFKTVSGARAYAAAKITPMGYKKWYVDNLRVKDILLQQPLPAEKVHDFSKPEAAEALQQPKPKQQQPPLQQQQPAKAKGASPKLFVGLGSEHNSNTKKGAATGVNVMVGYDMNKHFALGVNAMHSMDLDKDGTTELTAMLRYYLPLKGPFLQAEAGGAMNWSDINSIAPQGGMAAGWRLNVMESWFLEPSVRGGYPAVWGTGVTVGKKFGGE